MRHELNAVVEYEGERYSYSAIIWTGSDERRGEEVSAIEPQDFDLDTFVENDELYERVLDACIQDSGARLRYVGIENEIHDDETLVEYFTRIEEPRPTAKPASSPVSHSPAPWLISGEYSNNRDEIESSDGRTLAVVWTRKGNIKNATARPCYSDDPQGKANARLIASAPDLLSALEVLLSDYSKQVEHIILNDQQVTMIDNVYEAIRKATGAE